MCDQAKRFLTIALCAAFVSLLSASPAMATVAPGTIVKAVKVTKPPPQDAALTDPIWATAVRATDFENATTRQAARNATTALLLYDDKNLYVGFVVEQHGVPLTQTQTSNDVGYGLDDEVSIAIDTSGNNTRVYSFTSTPTGVRYEASSESARYQPPWATVTKQTADGYNVLMTIPLGDMRVGNQKSQSWRFNFSRYIAAQSNLLTWAYDAASSSYCAGSSSGATIYCDATRWPVLSDIALVGVAQAPPPYADIYALASAGRDKQAFETTPQNFTTQAARNVGLDATIPFTRSLAFVTTLGPDFSNVENDQTTIAPQEFPIAYSEYRPFFAQGANYISSLPGIGLNGAPNQIFYSPSLGIVDDGYKVEGTSGQASIGVLDAKGDGFNDQAAGLAFAKPDGTLTYSFEGVDANHPGVTDRTIGVGAGYQNLHSGFQPIFSFEEETGNLVSDAGLAHSLNIGEVTNHGLFETGVFYKDIGPEFAPVDGYTAINDVRGPTAFVSVYGPAAQQNIVKTYHFTLLGDRLIDDSGAAHEVDTGEDVSVLLKNLVSLGIGSGASELRTYARAYPYYTGPKNLAFDQSSLSLSYADGTPSPTDLTYSFGPYAVSCAGLPAVPLPCLREENGFTPAYTQQFSLATTRAFAGGYSATVTYAGTLERPFDGQSDSQFLRRISLSHALGGDSQIALTLREISGNGGNAAPGEALALSYHKRFTNQSQLYFEYGSPDAYRTLERFVLKYVYHLGAGGAGT
jgi:hypothetical protein